MTKLKEGKDYSFNESGNMVLSKEFLLRRGFCCKNGCSNCPYGFNENLEYSFWVLMEKLYEAKRAYYGEGRTSLTDQEYDALEESIKVIHGAERFAEHYQVGYCAKKHKEVSAQAKKYKDKFIKEFNDMSIKQENIDTFQ